MTFLLASVLRCRNACDALAIEEIERQIVVLTLIRDRSAPSARGPLDAVLRHARLIAREAPRLGEAIDALTAADGQRYDMLYASVQDRRAKAASVANAFRAALLALCVLLTGAVGAALWRLRREQWALASLNEHLETRIEDRTRDLETSREQYRVLLESTQAIPWEMEAATLRLSYVGPQAERALGHASARWLEEGFLAPLLHPDDRAAAREALAQQATDHELEIRLRNASGSYVWLHVFVSTGTDASGRVVRRGIFLDVTERRLLEAKVNTAQKLESIGRLAAGVAHEINTPVQFVTDNVHFTKAAFHTIGGLVDTYRELVRSVTMTVAERTAHAAEAEESADLAYLLEEVPLALTSSVGGLQKIATIVRSLTEFAKPSSGIKRDADLNAVVQNTLAVARSEYVDIAELELDLGDLPHVRCHAGEINQVILSLVVNAAHAITAANPDGKRGRISVRTRQVGNHVILRIEDTGLGVPEALRHKLFDPFFTTKDVGQGSGQGLSVARGIVVGRHGGELTFEPAATGGAAFVVTLPLASSESVVTRAA